MKKYILNNLIEEIEGRNVNNKVDISSFNYYTGSLDRAINELADEYVDNYHSDLFDWAKDNYNYINEAVSEYGLPENADMIDQITIGQYYANTEEINNNINDMLLIYIYTILINNNINELTEEQQSKVDKLVESMKKCNILYSDIEVLDKIKSED